jgi:SAM-dependent methyltransferase
MKLSGSKNIATHVEEFIRSNPDKFKGKIVVDFPAGIGRTGKTLLKVGAEVRPFDIFPDAFDVPGLTCQYGDMTKKFPIEDSSCDIAIFQEGIEHLADQLFALSEFNRILKPGGRLIVTTPNYSALRAKLSYLMLESEIRNLMPPNELESLWRPERHSDSKRVYLGHIFMIGIQKLRMLGWLAGFKIHRIHNTRINWTSAALMPIFYPFIWLRNVLTERRAIRKNTTDPDDVKRRTYRELRRLNTDPKILMEQHLFVELEKVDPIEEIQARLYSE